MCDLFVVCQLDCFFNGKESVEYFYMKASAVWYTWTELFVHSYSPSFLRAVCSTIELNAAKHPVYSEMFSVTNVRSRLASGLASLMANTHHFPWNGLGTNVILSFWCSNRNFSQQRRNAYVLFCKLL